MKTEESYAIKATLHLEFQDALEMTKSALLDQGFGVLCEINVDKLMQEKLGLKFRRYAILGACNPHFSKRMLETNPTVGVMLPCGVVVYEENGDSVVAAQDPATIFAGIGISEVEPIVSEVSVRIQSAIKELAEKFS